MSELSRCSECGTTSRHDDGHRPNDQTCRTLQDERDIKSLADR